MNTVRVAPSTWPHLDKIEVADNYLRGVHTVNVLKHPLGHLFVSYVGLNRAPNHEEPDDSGGEKSHHRVEAKEKTELNSSNLAPFPVDFKPAKSLGRVFVYFHSF